MNPQGKTRTLDGLELVAEVVLSAEAAEKQARRKESGEDLAAALLGGPLEWVNLETGPGVVNTDTGELVEDRSAAFAALLAFAADPSNHMAGSLDDGHGGTFNASGALWKSSLRIDPNWMETMRRRSRHRARAAMRGMMDGLSQAERLARQFGWAQRLTLKLVTLTMPHIHGSSSLDETKRINRALALLKKREVWRASVAGGVKGIEDALDADGPHVHAHLLVLSRFVERGDLVEAWRDCVDLATREAYGFGLAEDCPVIVDIRQVKRKPRPGRESETSWDDALNEVTKYVTKPADFMKPDKDGRRIPREVLLELCEVRRWPRMFELLGRCREQGGPARAQERPEAATAALVSIHRAYLAGEPIQVPDSIGWELVEAWDFATDGPEDLRKSIAHALKERERKKPDKVRPRSWRDLLDELDLPEWLSVMAERFRRGKKFRLNQILDANPNAYLVTFDGQVFGNPPAAAVVA